MRPPLSICLALYRRLANAYPHEFRMVYGEDLDRLGEDAIPEVWRRFGCFGLLRLLVDIAVRLPREYLGEIRRDIMYALRLFARSPGFTVVGILSMAMGIGMCSVILCGSNAMLGPLPGAHDPAALVMPQRPISYPYFEHYRDQRQVTAAAAVFLGPIPFAVAPARSEKAPSQRAFGHVVSPEYFSTLGVTPAAGRFFHPETTRPGTAPEVVVTDRFWRNYLNSDPAAIGRTLRLNGREAVVIGITPAGFLGVLPWNPADLFVPVTCGSVVAPELRDDPLHARGLEIFRMVLRLPHGVSIPQAETALNEVTRALDDQTPDPDRDRDRRRRLLRLIPGGTIMPLTPEQRAFVYSFNFILWGVVVSLLCANLANLLLARGAQRRPEIAIRLSAGASRARLVRQLLTESTLLSLAGGVAGILASYGITRILSSLEIPSQTPVRMDFHPDFRVLAVTLAISFIVGVGCGLAPAFSVLRTDLVATLKEGAQAPLRGYRWFGLRNLFMGYQVAASLMLLLVTGYMVIGYQRILRLDPGFETADLNLLFIDPVRDGYSEPQLEALLSKLPRELSGVSGVRAVALALEAPFANLSSHRPRVRFSAVGEQANGQPGQRGNRPRANRSELLCGTRGTPPARP